jgi:4-amino-4-deoxy-L-arabinose transferase-like glycosyltransferase
MPAPPRSAAAARGLLVASIACVVAFALLCPALYVDDSPNYLEPARSWASGHGLREAGRPLESRLPLYPLILGLLIRLSGESPVVFGLFNAACHVGAVLLVWSVLRRRATVAADVVAAAAMTYPSLVTSAALVLQESLLSFLLALAFVALWQAVEKGSLAWSGAAGLAFGLSGLAKVTGLPLVLPAAALVLRARPGLAAGLARGAVLVLGALAVLLPWAVRNRIELGRFEVTNGNGGQTVLGGTVSNEITNWSTFPEYVAACRAWEEHARDTHPSLDGYLYRVALDRIAAAPGRWALLVGERALRFMLPARHWLARVGLARTGTFPPWYVAATLVNLALFAGAGWAVGRGLRVRDPVLLVAPLFVFGHQLIYALTYASPRYAVTVGPILFGAAALAFFPSSSSPTSPGSPPAAAAPPGGGRAQAVA